MNRLVSWREQIVSSTTELFSHGPVALEHTLDHVGDPGLLGPESVSWPVIGDVAAFVGGVRALLIQAAHPEVAAGVADHSQYRQDPLGRLSRTSYYVSTTTYGAMPEVDAAVDMVRQAHRGVSGTSSRGKPYAATAPDLAGWVHNALTDSFLAAYQAYGTAPLAPADQDRFVAEQARIGHLLVDGDLPQTAGDLREALDTSAAIGSTEATRAAVSFLTNPPLPRSVRLGYRAVLAAAVAITPPGLREVLGIRALPGAREGGKAAVGALRWALGSSPTWQLALVRAKAPIPAGKFRQPVPVR